MWFLLFYRDMYMQDHGIAMSIKDKSMSIKGYLRKILGMNDAIREQVSEFFTEVDT
jgi:hypothetical protein